MSSSTSSSDCPTEAPVPGVPWGLVGALSAALLIEVCFSLGGTNRDRLTERFYPPHRMPTFTESIIQWQIFEASNLNRRQEVLFLGDSSCLMGLQPNVVVRETGLETWNLGTISWIGVRGHTRVLETYLQENPPPHLLVYHVTLNTFGDAEPHEFHRDFKRRVLRWLGTHQADASWLPSLSYRRDFRSWLSPQRFQDEFLELERGPYPSDRTVRTLIQTERGALVEKQTRSWKAPPRLQFHPEAGVERELNALFELAQTHGMKVLVMTNPLPDIAATEENLATLASVRELLDRAAAAFEGVEIAQPLAKFYDQPSQCCSSVNHLLPTGAQRNSEELAQWIRQRGFAVTR